jgi:glutathionylspermidine synthase
MSTLPQVPFVAGPALAPAVFQAVRLRTIFECFKWDPQVEDTSVLAPFPILLPRAVWTGLAQLAERLATDTIAAEAEILQRPELLKSLALPRAIWKLLAGSLLSPAPLCHPRVMRFDFHFTTEGWRISEVNSDVPGGFIEADGFTGMMAETCGLDPTGQPAVRLAEALVRCAARARPVIALVHASAYSDDRQVVTYLAREIEKLGATAVLVDPSQLRWNESRVRVESDWFTGEADALYRFFPAEWLPNLKRTAPWQHYFANPGLPQCNPGSSLISQSKRFGILLPQLQTAAPAWHSLLPETREVRSVDFRSPDWVFKPALGRVGEAIGIHGITPHQESKQIRRDMFFFPGSWVAQRRFEIIPIPTPAGHQYVCLGVYTIDGRAAGIYGRCSARPIINHAARDVAVLLKHKT